MTAYKILSTIFRTTTAFILIGASIAVPLSAAAAESSFLSAEIHAAATDAANSFKDALRLEIAETIRPPTAPQLSSVGANGQMDDVVQKDRLMSSDAADVRRGNDT